MTLILPLSKNPHPRTREYGNDPLPAGYLTANGMIIVRPCEWRSYSVKEMRWWEARFVKTGSGVGIAPMWCESRDLLVSLLDNPRIIPDKFIQVAQRTHSTACGYFEIQRNYFDKQWTCRLDLKEMVTEGRSTWAFTQPAWKDLVAWVAYHRISEPTKTRRECVERLQRAVQIDPPNFILQQLRDQYFEAHRKQRKRK